jgi:hypothetical protein
MLTFIVMRLAWRLYTGIPPNGSGSVIFEQILDLVYKVGQLLGIRREVMSAPLSVPPVGGGARFVKDDALSIGAPLVTPSGCRRSQSEMLRS